MATAKEECSALGRQPEEGEHAARDTNRQRGNKTKWQPLSLDSVVEVNNNNNNKASKNSSGRKTNFNQRGNRANRNKRQMSCRSHEGTTEHYTQEDIQKYYLIGYAPYVSAYPMHVYAMCREPDPELNALIRKQIEHYFSEENLLADVYLREHMDAEGYVPLSLVANFSRMKLLSQDIEIIGRALVDSELVEVDPHMSKVRPKTTPTRWPIGRRSLRTLDPRAPEFKPGVPYVPR